MHNMHKNRFLTFIVLLCIALPLASCAGDKKGDHNPDGSLKTTTQEPVETLYNRAAASLANRSFVEAARQFDDVDREYPYSQWATKAQLMTGYAYYKALKYDEAVMALDHYIELHPSEENIAYAWYLKSLCYYEQITDVRRDQQMTELALDALQQVVTRFPDSKYAKDANLKIDLTQDHLAGKEMEIGRYYLYRKQYQAAINRFQKVVTVYQTTTQVPEALERIVEAYMALGITDEARKAAAVLGYNYPNSSWYRDAYVLMKGDTGVDAKKKTSLYDRTLGKVIN